jgi:pimeloyl-ACP methyl ester carboxylesterase
MKLFKFFMQWSNSKCTNNSLLKGRAVKPSVTIFYALIITLSSILVTHEGYASALELSTNGIEPSSAGYNQGYVDLSSGLHMYYEIHGQGKPVILLHGGFMDTASWGATLTELAKSRQVIAFDLEGHGHTSDLNRPLTWAQMAIDVDDAVKLLGYKKVDVIGFSLGGVIALRMAMNDPNLVRKIVPISAIYDDNGYYPAIGEHWPELSLKDFEDSEQKAEYLHVAPEPEHWPVFFEKMRTQLVNFKGWSKQEISTIQSPALIIAGDNDAVRLDYQMDLYRMLGGDKAMGGFSPLKSELAILPNTTHFDIYQKAELLAALINPFLDRDITEQN